MAAAIVAPRDDKVIPVAASKGYAMKSRHPQGVAKRVFTCYARGSNPSGRAAACYARGEDKQRKKTSLNVWKWWSRNTTGGEKSARK